MKSKKPDLRILKVYRVYNDFDCKVYVGQTRKDLHERLTEHFTGEGALHLHRAVKKYGKEHFFIELIDTATTQAELDQKEEDWIKKLDSVKNGYNMVYRAHGGSEKVQMRWDRMTADERFAVNSRCNKKRWANASPESRVHNGQAMKAGWIGKDRSAVVKSQWDNMTEEQRKVRSDNMKAGWARRNGNR